MPEHGAEGLLCSFELVSEALQSVLEPPEPDLDVGLALVWRWRQGAGSHRANLKKRDFDTTSLRDPLPLNP